MSNFVGLTIRNVPGAFGRLVGRSVVAAGLVVLGGAGVANASPVSTVVETFGSPGAITPNVSSICGSANIVCSIGMDTFSSLATGSNPGYTSQFTTITPTNAYATVGTSLGSGTYSNLYGSANSEYGGTFISNNFPNEPNAGSTNTLSITNFTGGPGVNYFGMYISALDPFNQVTLYSGSKVIETVTQEQLIAALGKCTGGKYCGGGGLSAVPGGDKAEQFAYVNFFSPDTYITSVQFTELNEKGYNGQNFESSDYAIGYLSPDLPTGNSLVPEPSTIAMLMIGLLGLGYVRSTRAGASSKRD